MKLLKQTTLAAAIAAATAFTAHAGMVAMDDDSLSATTGQAGVTIETTTGAAGISIGSITYTDTDGTTAGSTNGGSVVIEGIAVKGATWNAATSTYDDAANVTKQTIDVDTHGNLITATENVSGNFKKITVDSVRLQANGQTTGATLVSNLEMIQASGDSSAHILNLANTNNGAVSGASYTINGNTVSLAGAQAAGANMAIVTDGESRIENLNVDALDGAIEVRGLKYDDGAGGMMRSTQVIWAKGGSAATGGGVYIAGSDSVGTLSISSIGIGGASIGSVTIRDLSQAGSVQRIYGH